ncbi:MAG: energy-coupling factor transporter transmembrane protein EcfT [Oscillospiraceae bacterium]|jgi:energy-coupling factor transport system permease protein|nr:energy-coupling factor transporter transmembrane protein EcfT [Oscillospiraceae bacterium]
MNKDAFYSYHPLISFLYFLLTIMYAMILTHPVCQALSLMGAISYAIFLNGKKAVRFNIFYMIPLLLVTVLINPAFTHQGVTILTYLPSGNPLTLESILYGVSAAFLLITVIAWFSCFNAVMTSDKLVYLFGRIIPALSLILSMSLRFVPRFTAQIKVISNAQRCVGRDVSNGGLLKRAKHGIKILSVLVTWALENAIDTADSMKARGYGLKGRTAFSIYRIDKRDKKALLFLLPVGGFLITGIAMKQLKFIYYPAVTELSPSAFQICLFAVFLALNSMPLFLNVKEGLKWKRIQQAQSVPSTPVA